jgi:hypothetical protein
MAANKVPVRLSPLGRADVRFEDLRWWLDRKNYQVVRYKIIYLEDLKY